MTVTVQQSTNSDNVDGMSCSPFVQEMGPQRSCSVHEQLSHNKLTQKKTNRWANDGSVMCSEQKQSETVIMHSNEKIDDKIDTTIVAAMCYTDGDDRNNDEQKIIKSSTNRTTNKNCDNFNEYETNEPRFGKASAVTAANAGGSGGGISSDSGVGIDMGIDMGLDDDDTDEDPYAELESYLEKVKVSVSFYKFFSIY